jgi:hypothetical protein
MKVYSVEVTAIGGRSMAETATFPSAEAAINGARNLWFEYREQVRRGMAEAILWEWDLSKGDDEIETVYVRSLTDHDYFPNVPFLKIKGLRT